MYKFALAAVIAAGFTLSACQPENTTTVDTTLGALSGDQQDGVNAYLGVPYAEAPKGDLRWAPPQPKQPWSGNRKAYRSRSACVQGGAPTGAIGSSEDCLYLDIWAPATPGPHPVMVWLHGGGFLLGAGTELHYRGKQLAQERDVVVVSVNYRLSYLGLLAHPELAAERGHGSGNQAFLDQLEALRFVKREIASFGGDPDNITVFGESAGAMSACVLMASPLSSGLIDHVIMESAGCNTIATRTQAEAETQGVALFEKLGCPAGAGQLACARAVPEKTLKTILKPVANELFFKMPEDWVYSPAPAVDNHLLPKKPVDLLKDGINSEIDVLLGSNLDEGSLFVLSRDFVDSDAGYDAYLQAWYPEQATALKTVYPLAAYQGKTGEAVAALAGHGFIACPTQWVARILADSGHQVYNYQFTQKVTSAMPTLFALLKGDNAPDMGIFHSAEIPFVFGNVSVFGSLHTPEEKSLHEAMSRYWTNFARQGDPNGSGLANWPRYDNLSGHYLQLDSQLDSKSHLLGTQCDYWINEVYQAE